MATYPFVRLEEARRRLLDEGVEVIDFGKGDPNEPTDPMIRQALVDALPERSPYPLAQGLPELRAAQRPDGASAASASTLDPDTEIVPTYGSKEAIYSLAQVLVDPRSDKRTVLFGEPAYPVYERGALVRGRAGAHGAARARARIPAGAARDPARVLDRTAIFWVNYPNNPTGAVAPLSFYEQLSELAERYDFVDRAPTRRTASCGSTSRRRRRCRSRDRSRMIVFQTLSKRSSMTGYRSGFVAAPAEVIAALKSYRPNVGTAPQEFVQRASVVAWNDERHVAETRDALPRQARRAHAGDRGQGLGDRRERGDDVPVGGRARTTRRSGCSSAASSCPPATFFGPSGAGYIRFALVPTLDECTRAAAILAEPVTTEETIEALDRGELRVAEKVGGEWRVNEDAKAAILDYFRLRKLEPIEVGPYEYLDKIPLKRNYAELGVRVVPPATARYGSFLSPGVVMMPSYVNIGAWVGPNTMIDTWATVGSCAQIGADVHLAGGVGVGGVLEPVQARPVIVEDGAFIGSRCILTEGVADRRARRAGAERVADRLGAGHRRHRARSRSSIAATCRPTRSSSPARGRRSSPPGRISSGARSSSAGGASRPT